MKRAGGAPVGRFSPDAGYERRVSYRGSRGRGRSAGNGCDLVNVRDRVTNEIIAIIIAYNGVRVVVLEEGTET